MRWAKGPSAKMLFNPVTGLLLTTGCTAVRVVPTFSGEPCGPSNTFTLSGKALAAEVKPSPSKVAVKVWKKL